MIAANVSGVDERGAEARIAGRLDEVADADERAAEPRQPQVVPVERLPAGRRDRHERADQDERQRGRDQHRREPSARRGRVRVPPRVMASVRGARPARARSARISRGRARCRAAGGRCCPLSARCSRPAESRTAPCRPASPAAGRRRRARPDSVDRNRERLGELGARRTASGAPAAARRSAPARASARARSET